MKKYFINTLNTSIEINLVNFDKPLRAYKLTEETVKSDLIIYMIEDGKGNMISKLKSMAREDHIEGNLLGEYYILFNPSKKITFCFFEKEMQLESLVNKTVNLSFLVFQNSLNVIFLHTASAVIKNKTNLFIAPSGGGKSTFCSLAREEGLDILDDEVCMIKKYNSKFYASTFPCLMPFDFQLEHIEIEKVFFLNKSKVDEVCDIAILDAIKKAMPEATCFFQDKIPAVGRIEYRKHIFNFLSSMFDELEFKTLNFKNSRDIFACIT